MSKYNVEKNEYVSLLNKAFSPLTTFGSLDYIYEQSDGAEFIKYEDAMCTAKFLNITSFDNEDILFDVISTVIAGDAKSIIKDDAKKRAIAKLFKEKGSSQ